MLRVVAEAATACIKEALVGAGEEATEAELLELELVVEQAHWDLAMGLVAPSVLRGACPDVPAVAWADIGGLEVCGVL